ncbi:hypothetical protein O3M35_003217 [Rhynocoris fuscipes]|uniref:Uncharacterized protein n=1 Tax=Rhynocoris fuscipes TaxID=488301 RepID=A0AAW1CIA4_9HEMI
MKSTQVRWLYSALTVLIVMSICEAITSGGPYRKQHQQTVYVGGVGGVPVRAARWQHHPHQRNAMVAPPTRVHRSGPSNHYHPAVIPGSRYRAGPPPGPVKRVYLPYKYLPPQIQQKFRYSVNGPPHSKRPVMNGPPPGWKPKRTLHPNPSMHAHNSYMPPRKNKHPGKYIPNAGKLSHISGAPTSVVTDSYGAPYKLTSTTYGVPHPTQGAPEPPASNGIATATKDVPTSFIQVYQGNNNREMEAQTSYSFGTQHQVPYSMTKPRVQHQMLSSQHLSVSRPAKPVQSAATVTSLSSYHHDSNINESPVYRPSSNNTTNKVQNKLIITKDSSNTYGGFQPPKQTYGFLPYDDKDGAAAAASSSSSSSSSVVGVGSSVTSDQYYSGNSNNNNANSQSQSSSSSVTVTSSSSSSPSSSVSSSHQTREEYLSPNYYQQKS